MLDLARYTGTHWLVGLAAVFLLMLVAAGAWENVFSSPARRQEAPSLSRGASTPRLGARLTVGVLKLLAFVLLERWFYGALADLAGIAAGIAPILFLVASTLGQNAQLAGALDMVGSPAVTVRQTITVVAICAIAVVLFRGIAAAIPEPRRR